MPTDRKLAFTKARLAGLPVPQDKRVYYYDSRTEGLALCVTPTGTKTFYLYRWASGRPMRIPLGRFPTVSIEAAAKQARALLGEIAKGNDPQQARQAARHEQTVGGLWSFWLEAAKGRTKTWAEDERRYRRFLQRWANRKLSTIRKSDVADLFARVARENGKYAANRLLALVKAMFHRASDLGFNGPDPTAGIKKFREEKRDRFIHADEMQRFFACLLADPNPTLRDLLLVCLLTGARKGNVMSMRWDQIDFATSLWRIPETKAGRPVVIPLVAPVVALLQTRRAAADASPWVFPGRGTTGHITEIKSAWKRIAQAANLADVRPHDLRRSLASYMAIEGTSLLTIGAMLGHSQTSSTAVYARLTTDPVRVAAERATTAILAAGGLVIEADGVKLLQAEPAAADALHDAPADAASEGGHAVDQ